MTAVNSYEAGTQPDFYLGVAEEIRAQRFDLGCGTGIVTFQSSPVGAMNDRGRSLPCGC